MIHAAEQNSKTKKEAEDVPVQDDVVNNVMVHGEARHGLNEAVLGEWVEDGCK